MNSAEGDADVELVSILHAAVTGYAPIIYNINTNMDFRELLKQCWKVWRVLEQDPSLPNKLVSFNLEPFAFAIHDVKGNL